MEENTPKELYFDLPIDEKEQFEPIKDIFIKHNALHHYETMSEEVFRKEIQGKEYIVEEMMRKEYIRKYKGGYYYDKKMESDKFRLHIKTVRFMIILMFIINFILVAGLAWGFYEGFK